MGKKKSNNNDITCDQCSNCMYEQEGDMHCDVTENFDLVYEEFCPTENYMWCNGQHFESI